MKRLNPSILLILLLFLACQKDSDIFIPYNDPIPEISYVVGSVGGAVIDETGNPLANASIKLSTKTTQEEMMTDENGIFYFRNVEINVERTYLQIESEGYFSSSRNFKPRESGTEFLKIQLMSATSSGSYEATDGGLVDVMGGGSVDLPAYAVVDASGDIYEGTVNVAARYLNPMDNELGERMPGNLMAINSAGEKQILATYGMMAVKLFSVNGDHLQIAPDKHATLRIPIPDALLNNAPTTIPLWYFDETMGLWVEEGQGQLVGDYYEGQVKHFTFWNWDVPYDLVNINATISIFETNTPFANAYTKVTVVNSGICATGYTDNQGSIDGAVPAGQVLLLQIFDNCFTEVYAAEIGPFSGDVDLGNIVVNPIDNNVVQLSGHLSCDGEVVTEGYIKVTYGENNNFYFVDATGSFSTAFDVCSADGFELTGVDIVNNKQSITTYYTAENELDAGTLMVCEELEEFIHYTIDGETYEVLDPSLIDSLQELTYINGSLPNSTFSMNVEGYGIGTFNLLWLTVNGVSQAQGSAPEVTITFSEYGAAGELVIGTFEGTYYGSDGNEYTIQGNFKIIKDN